MKLLNISAYYSMYKLELYDDSGMLVYRFLLNK